MRVFIENSVAKIRSVENIEMCCPSEVRVTNREVQQVLNLNIGNIIRLGADNFAISWRHIE